MLTGEVVPANIVGLSVLDESPDIGALEVLEVIVVGGAQLGAHAAVVAGDDDAAATRRDLGVDAVLDAQTGLLAGIAKDGGVLVIAGTAQVDDAVVRQDILGTTGSVLGSTAGDQLGIVVVEEVLVDVQVLGLSQDGIVGLEVVLLEQVLVAKGLDVWQAPPCQPRSRRPTFCESTQAEESATKDGQCPLEHPMTKITSQTYRGEGSPGRAVCSPWWKPC